MENVPLNKSYINLEKEDLIYKYFHLDQKIKALNNRYAEIVYNFDHASFTPWIEYNGEDIHMMNTRVDTVVIEHIATLELIELKVKICKRRKKYFNQFLKELTKKEYFNLKSKYATWHYEKIYFSKLDSQVYEEILEIEEAIGYQFSIETIRDPTNLSFDEIEDEFQKMMNELGV